MRRFGMLLLAAFAAGGCGTYTAKATVTVAVTGPGSVRGAELQGDCRSTCWFQITRETPVHLEPVTDAASVFSGWSGACTGTGPCDLKPGTDVSVSAAFAPAQQRRLQVSMNGAGTVRSDPAGIDCPRTCAADFPDGTAVRLQASPDAGWDFTGFGGACSGASCSVTLFGDLAALATFAQRPATLSVQMSGNGSVLSSPAGIDCPRVCSAVFGAGTAVTLTASPASGSRFTGFSGACTGGSCSLRISSDAQVAAQFAAIPTHSVTVVVGGSGQGRIVSSPAGIDCPGTCSATFAEGSSVALSATPHLLSKFVGYSGTCSGARCALTLTADAAISVEFALKRYVATDLGGPTGAWWSSPIGISPRGLRVAGAWGGAAQGVFLWDGSMHDIGVTVGTPMGVNESGTVVGASWDGNQYQWHAFRWSNGTTTLLDSLGGTLGWGAAVSGAGVVVGWSTRGDGAFRATRWDPKGSPVDLGSVGDPWYPCSAAYAINSSGVAVGETCTAGAGTRAARFNSPGQIDDLGSLGGYASARAISDSGIIVGYSVTPNGVPHGFVYADGKMVDVGTIVAGSQSQLMGVNGTGIAVGNASGPNGLQRAIVYAAGQMLDLNTIVDGTSYTLTLATGIDEAGNIVAQGLDRWYYQRAVLLRPQ